jgi:hypothetical protein
MMNSKKSINKLAILASLLMCSNVAFAVDVDEVNQKANNNSAALQTTQAGAKATGDALNAEIAARIAADTELQNNINTISLTPGPQGEQGIQGLTGDAGSNGTNGVDGAQGAAGTNGLDGQNGVDGAQGPQGVAGPAGDQGIQGETGTAGVDGANGADGAQGSAGADGADGTDGADGVTPWTDNGTNLSTGVSIQIGDETITCDSTTAGTIRWTGTDFEGCDGTAWVSLSSPGSGDVVYAIGDTGPAGGKVFYVTDDGLHGLEAAPEDQSRATWGCYTTLIAGADETRVGSGARNTADILSDCVGSAAAGSAASYTLNGYVDWFLPSKDELNLLYLHKDVVGGFATDYYYWSSTEVHIYTASSQGFSTGDLNNGYKSFALYVRAVRAF